MIAKYTDFLRIAVSKLLEIRGHCVGYGHCEGTITKTYGHCSEEPKRRRTYGHCY